MLSSSLVQRLGYAGLIPFISLASWTLFDSAHSQYATSLFSLYSAVILSFMAGALWGRLLNVESPTHSKHVFIVTNITAVLAWLVLAIGVVPVTITVLMLSFIAVLWSELRYVPQTPSNYPTYSTMRFVLTSVVVVCHLVILIG